ncbi:hypothetical protein FACS1894205_5180 [Alphaproteobacteria bacterium]|nr:hypothetical protein FACS1894205_5180 [Alphaproteobacteria bacterium]
MLGSRVLLSSATLPPSLVEGMFDAYCAGRKHFQKNRGAIPEAPPVIGCAWIDEFNQTRCDCADTDSFSEAHRAFAQKRHALLAKAAREQPLRRMELIFPFAPKGEEESRRECAERALQAALCLHERHASIDPESGKRVSFGLIRMANIEPLYDIALKLFEQGAPENRHIHLCVYHSQFPLLIRSRIEKQLDQALNRRKPDAVFALPDVRRRIDAAPEANHLFIVLGSPVTEVGRDHDYDWAIVEPSSMRSLIQLAGRVRRHRKEACATPNIFVFDTNLRHCKDPNAPAFCKPGFESGDYRLKSHSLEKLLRPEECGVIDARPRILPHPEFDASEACKQNLGDLEHKRLLDACRPRTDTLNVCGFWTIPHIHLTAILSQRFPFRDDPIQKTDLALLLNEDETDYHMHKVFDGAKRWEKIFIPGESKNQRIPDDRVRGVRIEAWGVLDYLTAIREQADEMDLTPTECARRYGGVTLPKSEQGWRFHPALGFSKKK